MSDVIIHCHQLVKQYQQGDETLPVIRGVDFTLHRGESVAIIGSSGAGKSTLLNLLGGLDRSSSGYVEILDKRLDNLSANELAALRNQAIGFVYQFHHLLTEFDAQENVAMPLLIGGMKKHEAMSRAADMLAKVGLAARGSHRPAQLSGGERQRVAIARALVGSPACVLMDEPTGNLDEQTADQVQALLTSLNRELGICFIIVTHDRQIARQQQRVLCLQEGLLHELSANELA